MKKKIRKAFLSLVISKCTVNAIALVMMSVPFICSSKTFNTSAIFAPGDKSIAYFDDFVYKGNDDYYKSNPLSDKTSFYSTILPGWNSDPSICTNGKGDYFLVTSTFCYFPGVPIFHSRDLVNWKQIGYVLNRPSQLINFVGQGVSGGIFAPAISYNPHNQTYYMITTNVGAGNFFVKTKNPYGSWSEPVYLRGVKGIDPSFFFDDNGKAYIVNNADPDTKPEYDGHRAIRVQEFDVKKETTIDTPGKVVVNKGSHPEENPIWIEGPHLYKIKGKYFLMCAEGGTSGNHSEVIFRSNSPMGPFVPWKNNPILTQRNLDENRPYPITCAGHADLIQAKEGDWWAVFLACRPINNKLENLGRETFIMPVKWSNDGYPYMTQGKEIIPMIQKRKAVMRASNVTFGNFEKEDDFSSKKLGMDWLTLRGPATNLYSFKENPGYLALHCSDISATDKKTPAFIGRRMQHHKFECTTKMIFNSSNQNAAAGLLLFKDETHQYFLAVSNKGVKKGIALKQISKDGSKELAQQTIKNDGGVIGLKVVSKGLYYDFYYSTLGHKWKLLCQNIDAKYLSTANCGGFTGTTIGLYAVK
jgi:xylan 1,4-beta-xylosidase